MAIGTANIGTNVGGASIGAVSAVKPQTNLPYVQPNQMLPLAPTAPILQQPGVQPIQQPSTQNLGPQVLQTAQQKAIQGFSSPTLALTSQATQNLLQNPMQGYDAGKAKQQALESYDIERSNALKALGGEMADVGHLGTTLDKLSQNYLQGATGRVQLERQIDLENQDKQRAALLAAIASGRETATTEANRFSTDIGALTAVTGAGEGVAQREFTAGENTLSRTQQLLLQSNDIEGQKSLAELKAKMDRGTLLQSQDFEATQKSLDRQLQEFLAKGDTAKAIQLLNMQQDFQSQMQTAQNEYSKAERVATQSWQTGERVSTEDYNKGLAYFDRETQTLVNGQKIQADLQMQLAGFSQQDKMVNLQSQLEEAKANNDVGRQKSIIGYQDALASAQKLQEQGFIKTQSEFDAAVKKDLQSQDIESRKYLQQKQTELELAMQTAGFNDAEKKMYLQNQFDTATQTAGYRRALKLQEQKAGFDNQAMELQSKLAEARAQKDYGRESQLMDQQAELNRQKTLYESRLESIQSDKDYQHALSIQDAANEFDFKKQAAQFGQERALQSVQAKIDTALKTQDFDQAMRLNKQQFTFTAQENEKDRVIEKLKVDLQAKGLNMTQWEQQYNAIKDQEDAGTVAPGAAREFLNKQIAGTGVTLQETKPEDEYRALNKEYEKTQYQYLLTHPNGADLKPGAVETIRAMKVPGLDTNIVPNMVSWALKNRPDLVGLNPASLSDFNKFMNKTLYQSTPKNISPADATEVSRLSGLIETAKKYLDPAKNSAKTVQDATNSIATYTGQIQAINNKYAE